MDGSARAGQDRAKDFDKKTMTTHILPPASPFPTSFGLIGILRRWDWPTVAVMVLCAGGFALALTLPAGWGLFSWPLLVLALTLHSSLSHEMLHGHPFNSHRASTVIGLFQPGLFVPYLRFRALHLAHHRDADLTDPYDDPESNYLDPAVWDRMGPVARAVLGVNNTLLGRMALGPLIGMGTFLWGDLRRMARGEREVALHWVAHLPGVVVTLWLVGLSAMPLWAYLAACYAALSVLRIRTFLEHQAHEKARGRSVIIEDRGLLAFLFLNNNYHAVHHMHPSVAWYRLPAIYRARKARFLWMNRGYVFRSYGEVFGRYLLRRKDPVAHPLWQGPRK
ncbi:fatty acid desaturase [Marimonas sp. MJW-29]|uniref:Fatty acid desaturase n=1 Tax=Sulfitobacter sediminis TaxID=3234186 RepID=A0ABV3RM38_9RHOB